MKYVVALLVVLLIVLHQDNWLWDDPRLLFGFLPIGLAYHAAISIGAALTWYLATIYCWPIDMEESESASGASANEESA